MASFDEILKGNKRFAFSSDAFKADVAVVSMTGHEGISRMFRFELILVSNDANVDFDSMLSHPATFKIFSADGSSTTPYHGILSEFELLHQIDKHFTFYRAVLVPNMWRLSLNRISDIYLGKRKTPDLIKLILDTDKKLTHDVRAPATYYDREFVCQHMETHFDFISRWMERDGLYYYFAHGDSVETLTVIDAKESLPPDSVGVEYRPADKLDTGTGNTSVQAFIGNQRPLPKTVTVYDYYYDNAKVSFKFDHEVSKLNSAVGEVMLQGEHIRSDDEGKRYALIRSQELACTGRQFAGESTVVGLRSGYFMEMRGHYRDAFNAKYLVTEIEHRGSQAGALLSGLDTPYNRDKNAPATHYANSFQAIPSDVQFRPARVTAWPQLTGTVSAVIDSSSADKIADLDAQGRYLVKFRFNKTQHKDGEGSVRIRMASPYAGTAADKDGNEKSYGMHTPLHKGAEVLLSFEGGDPDRPVIMSAVANSEKQNVVNDKNRVLSRIVTRGNEIVLDDTEGEESVTIKSKSNDSKTVIGYNPSAKGFGGFWRSTSGSSTNLAVGSSSSIFVGNKTSYSLSIDDAFSYGLTSKVASGKTISYAKSTEISWKEGDTISVDDSKTVQLKKENKVMGFEKVWLAGGQRPRLKDASSKIIAAVKRAVDVNSKIHFALSGIAATAVMSQGGKVAATSLNNAYSAVQSLGGAYASTLVTQALEKSAKGLSTVIGNGLAYASNIRMGDDGIDMTVDNLAPYTKSRVEMKSDQMTLTAYGGKLAGTSTIAMKPADLKITAGKDALASDLTLNDKLAELSTSNASGKVLVKHPSGGNVTADSTGLVASATSAGGATVSLDQKSAKLQLDDSTGFWAKSTLVSASCAAAKLKLSSISADLENGSSKVIVLKTMTVIEGKLIRLG